MNSLHLKLLAVATMLIDHIGFLFFPDELAWRIIGRLSFPLFAFLIAEGYLKTSNKWKYFNRLALFGFISQIPYTYFESLAGSGRFSLNIFFTLASGLVALAAIEKIKYGFFKIATIVLILAVAETGGIPYGMYGILTIMASYLFLKNRDAGTAGLAVLPMIDAFGSMINGGRMNQAFALFSLIPILSYDGTLGPKVSRWWFYWFYPVHMVILSVIHLVSK